MEPLRWEPRFESGDEVIDFQHQVLFALMNEVHGAAIEGDVGSSPREMLAGFARYARMHFVREEELMRATGYPDLEPHRREHEALCDEITRLSALDSGVEVLDVCALAYDWLVQHILGADLPMIEHVRRETAA